MPEFLHGVETIETLVGPRAIREVKSAIIGLVGTAPLHHGTNPPAVNSLVLVRTDRDNAQFGSEFADGYTIPRALLALQKLGAGTVFVVNVFDPTVHFETVASASRNIVSGRITLPNDDIISLTVTTNPSSGSPVACALGTDYTVNKVTGVITVITGGLLDGELTALVGYTHGAPENVEPSDVIGTTTGGGVRTGMQAWRNAMPSFGFGPKVLIAPGFSSEATVRDGMVTLAHATKLRAIVLADAPVGATMNQVIAGRGVGGVVDLLSANERLFYQYPHVKVTNPATGIQRLEPLSQYMAGRIAATDYARGYWKSPSNMALEGIAGIEFPLTASLSDPTCDVNALNEVGVNTVFAAYGAGFRAWGNRSAAFPVSQAVTTFMSVRRTIDMIDEAVEQATLTYVDDLIGDVLVQAVLADVTAFINLMVSRGALLTGSRVEYFPEDNPIEQLGAGKLVFTKTFLPPPSAERITYKSVIDVALLASIGA